MNEIDEELVKVIDESISSSTSFVEALGKVIEWKKKNRGLKGFHISSPPDVLCGTRKVKYPADEADRMAHDVLMMERDRALGQCRELTGDELEMT